MFVLQEKETTVLCLFVKIIFFERVKISEKSDTKECYQELNYVQPPLENNYKLVFVFSVLFQQGCQRCWLGHAGCSYLTILRASAYFITFIIEKGRE